MIIRTFLQESQKEVLCRHLPGDDEAASLAVLPPGGALQVAQTSDFVYLCSLLLGEIIREGQRHILGGAGVI